MDERGSFAALVRQSAAAGLVVKLFFTLLGKTENVLIINLSRANPS